MKGFLIRCIIGIAIGIILIMSFIYGIASLGSDNKVHADDTYSSVGDINVSTTGNAIVDKAVQIMQYMMDHNYAYTQGNKVPLKANEDAGKKCCDCSTFVCWVLYDLGYTNAQSAGSQLSTYSFDGGSGHWFQDNGWKRVNSYSEMEPGDIVLMKGGNHIQIFAYRKDGVNYWINCGWPPYEHTSPYEAGGESEFYSGWRCPKKL